VAVTFFDDWIAASEDNERAVNTTRVAARGSELVWEETPNDHRFAFLISRHVGFATMGTHLGKAILPVNAHTGKQRHGEEAIHITRGRGFAVIDERRYDFAQGTTIHVPYMSVHQIFNAGDEEVEYVTAGTTDLDLFVRLGRVEQLEEKGFHEPGFEDDLPQAAGHFDDQERRIVLNFEDAPNETEMKADLRRKHGEDWEKDRGRHTHDHEHRHGAIYILMGGGESLREEANGFTSKHASMTNVFEEIPNTSSHCHSHTEAMLYVLEGSGYSEIDFQRYEWSAGDAVHVPPKMTRHEHFNPSDNRTRTLRVEFGIRYFYEDVWEGYQKVEHRQEAAVIDPSKGHGHGHGHGHGESDGHGRGDHVRMT
jgi:quercetin dioxygenase-like cupin family protein